MTHCTLLLGAEANGPIPSLLWLAPFVALLACIANLPLIKETEHWWHSNRNKLLVALLCAAAALLHYATRSFGTVLHADPVVDLLRAMGFALVEEHGHFITRPGLATLAGALGNSLWEYVPFIVMLFALYAIAGGVLIRGDMPAHPITNTTVLAIGGVLASLIGTTGASMLLIRPLLQINSERRIKVHTFVFFIFAVSNIGGCLLPIGDPPLFIGYLKGVPFLWTLVLWKEWAFMLAGILAIYFVWDVRAYKREDLRALILDEETREPVRIFGAINFLWLAVSVVSIALLAPGQAMPGTSFVPPPLLREAVLLGLVGVSFLTTPKGLRRDAGFTFFPIAEVAALFIGIFVCLQIPLEILSAKGASLGLTRPWHYFWATGLLSSVLDNAPTYAVFLQVAISTTDPSDAAHALTVLKDGTSVRQDLLVAVSLGSVFMGANTYIGNGPNFMVKSIVESHRLKMPSFFRFAGISIVVLMPLYALMTVLFL